MNDPAPKPMPPEPDPELVELARNYKPSPECLREMAKYNQRSQAEILADLIKVMPVLP